MADDLKRKASIASRRTLVCAHFMNRSFCAFCGWQCDRGARINHRHPSMGLTHGQCQWINRSSFVYLRISECFELILVFSKNVQHWIFCVRSGKEIRRLKWKDKSLTALVNYLKYALKSRFQTCVMTALVNYLIYALKSRFQTCVIRCLKPRRQDLFCLDVFYT